MHEHENTVSEAPGLLSRRCLEFLAVAEVSAELLAGGQMVALHDADGDHLFNVSAGIDPRDLHTLFRIHRSRWEAGRRFGASEARAEIRLALGLGAETGQLLSSPT